MDFSLTRVSVRLRCDARPRNHRSVMLPATTVLTRYSVPSTCSSDICTLCRTSSRSLCSSSPTPLYRSLLISFIRSVIDCHSLAHNYSAPDSIKIDNPYIAWSSSNILTTACLSSHLNRPAFFTIWFCLPLNAPAFSTPTVWSVIFQSCIFRTFVFWSVTSGPAFSIYLQQHRE